MADEGWILRPYDPATDDGLIYLLGVAYARSGAGRREQASGAGRPMPDYKERQARREKTVAFIESHRGLWVWLLEHATTILAVDAENPHSPHGIWGWLIMSEPNVIHAIGVKRSCIKEGLGLDILKDLLGERMHSHQVTTLELPQLRSQRPGWKPNYDLLGIDRPKEWSLDPSWLPVRLVA